MSMKPAPWAYLTNTVLVTVAFLLFLNTNMLRHSLVTTLSYLTLHYMTKLIHLNKKAYLQSSDHHIKVLPGSILTINCRCQSQQEAIKISIYTNTETFNIPKIISLEVFDGGRTRLRTWILRLLTLITHLAC